MCRFGLREPVGPLRCRIMWVWCELVHNGETAPLLSTHSEAQASGGEPWSLGIDDRTGVRVARSSLHSDLNPGISGGHTSELDCNY